MFVPFLSVFALLGSSPCVSGVSCVIVFTFTFPDPNLQAGPSFSVVSKKQRSFIMSNSTSSFVSFPPFVCCLQLESPVWYWLATKLSFPPCLFSLIRWINLDHGIYKTQTHANPNEYMWLWLPSKIPLFTIQTRIPTVESLNDLLKQVTQYHAKKINWEPLDPDFMSFTGSSPDGSADKERRSDTVFESQHSKSNNNSIKKSSSSGSSLDPSEVQGVYNWEFTSSLLFVTSLVTTIGYGHVSPLTQFGKVLAIIFSTIGIPLTLTLLSTLSSLLLRSPIRRFETSLAIVATRLTSKANVLMVRLSHLAIITIIFLIICFFLPAYIFHRLEEGWTYLDSIYYCYISLTTIGLGDFVPASTITNDTDLTYYRIGTVLYLYFGLTLIVLWLALVYRIPQLNLNQILLSTETDNKLKQRETLRILNTCSRVQETPSTSRSSLSKSYGTQNVATPTTPWCHQKHISSLFVPVLPLHFGFAFQKRVKFLFPRREKREIDFQRRDQSRRKTYTCFIKWIVQNRVFVPICVPYHCVSSHPLLLLYSV